MLVFILLICLFFICPYLEKWSEYQIYIPFGIYILTKIEWPDCSLGDTFTQVLELKFHEEGVRANVTDLLNSSSIWSEC